MSIKEVNYLYFYEDVDVIVTPERIKFEDEKNKS